MTDPKQIPHLLTLWDDESPIVKNEVMQAFMAFGGRLEALLTPYWWSLSPHHTSSLKTLCREMINTEFSESWSEWLSQPESDRSLEKALSILDFVENGYTSPSFEERLNSLSERFLVSGQERNAAGLLTFLFVDEKLGPPIKFPFHAFNSHPIQALKTKGAYPIGLGSLAMILSKRLGITLNGFSMPGNFFLLEYHERGVSLYDPYQKGFTLDSAMVKFHLATFRRKNGNRRALHASTDEIVLEIMSQIITGHIRNSETEKVKFYNAHYRLLLSKTEKAVV